MMTWQLQKAKARLSELIKKAAKEGPQSITIHGQPTAVILSSEEYERLTKPTHIAVTAVRRQRSSEPRQCYFFQG